MIAKEAEKIFDLEYGILVSEVILQPSQKNWKQTFIQNWEVIIITITHFTNSHGHDLWELTSST